MRKLPLPKPIPPALAALAVLLVGFFTVRSIERILSPIPTLAISSPATALPTPSPALTLTPTIHPADPIPSGAPPTAQPTLTPTAALPEAHIIQNIRGHHQYFALGCETAAAKDWANYFGHDFNEFEFQYKLPLSDNPDYGFVGDVTSDWGQVPPYAYGVYAGPVADLLTAYGIPAKAYKGDTLERLKANVAQDKPVIVWVIGNVEGGIPAEYTDSQGRKTVVAAFEHVVIVTGYSATTMRYMSNGKFSDTPTEVFLNSWGVLGKMAVEKPN